MESELAEIVSELGDEVSSSLIDSEGFPRGGIDIASIITLRRRALLLKNDISFKVKEIESALVELHRTGGEGPIDSGTLDTLPPAIFCVVGPVEPESPACKGNLKEGDRVFAWGRIRPVKQGDSVVPSLKELGEVARECEREGAALNLSVVRGGVKMFLNLRPSAWKGAGILGCTILPAL